MKSKDSVILGGVEGAKLRLHRTRGKEKKQEKELYEREHPKKTKFVKGIKKAPSKISKVLHKAAKVQVTKKKILKSNKMEVRIPQRKVESVLADPNRFFTHQMEETRKSMFFS